MLQHMWSCATKRRASTPGRDKSAPRRSASQHSVKSNKSNKSTGSLGARLASLGFTPSRRSPSVKNPRRVAASQRWARIQNDVAVEVAKEFTHRQEERKQKLKQITRPNRRVRNIQADDWVQAVTRGATHPFSDGDRGKVVAALGNNLYSVLFEGSKKEIMVAGSNLQLMPDSCRTDGMPRRDKSVTSFSLPGKFGS